MGGRATSGRSENEKHESGCGAVSRFATSLSSHASLPYVRTMHSMNSCTIVPRWLSDGMQSSRNVSDC